MIADDKWEADTRFLNILWGNWPIRTPVNALWGSQAANGELRQWGRWGYLHPTIIEPKDLLGGIIEHQKCRKSRTNQNSSAH